MASLLGLPWRGIPSAQAEASGPAKNIAMRLPPDQARALLRFLKRDRERWIIKAQRARQMHHSSAVCSTEVRRLTNEIMRLEIEIRNMT